MKFLISLFVLATLLLTPIPASAAEIFTNEKLVTVDTSKQQLTAWENGKIVYQTKVSTGLKQSPTILGSFKIYTKIPKHDMKGVSPVYGKYFHPDVLYSMYFYKGYALHAAYWHSNFGYRMSNGCVNLSTKDAEWLYNWAEVGTRVETY